MKTAPDNRLQESSRVQESQYNGIANRIISKIMTKILVLVFIITTSFRQIGGVLGGCYPLRTTSNRFYLKTPHFSAITRSLHQAKLSKILRARTSKKLQITALRLRKIRKTEIRERLKTQKREKRREKSGRKRKERKREKTKIKKKEKKKRQGSSRLLTIGFRACQRFL